MRVDVRNEEIIIQYLNTDYIFTSDELRLFQIEVELIPSQGFYEAYYWIRSTSKDPIYQEMSALVFCDLEDALKWKSRQPQRKRILQ